MAEQPIRKEDIIDVEGTITGLKEVSKLLGAILSLMENIKTQAKEGINVSQALNPADKSGQNQIAVQVREAKELKTAYNELSESQKKLELLQKKLNATLKDSAYSEAELSRMIQENNKVNRDQAKYNSAAEGSLARLRIELARLKKEYAEASPAKAKGMVSGIQQLTKEVTKAEKAIGVHTRGVGSYKESIMAAGKQLAGFLGVASGAVIVLNKLKDAFAGTEEGTKFLNTAGLQLKTFFQNIVQGNFKYAFGNELPKDMVRIGEIQDEIRKRNRDDLKEIARLEGEINQARLDSAKAGLTDTQTIELVKKAIEKETELLDYKIKDKEEELELTKQILEKAKGNTFYMDQQAQLEAEIIALKSDKSLKLAREEATLQERITATLEKQKEIELEHSKFILDAASSADAKKIETAQLTSDSIAIIRDNDLIKNEEFYKKQDKAAEDAAQAEIDYARQVYAEKLAIMQELAAATNSIGDIVASSYEKQKQREIRAAGDNAKEVDRINKEYAKKEQDLAITMAVINGALAITMAWAQEKTWYMALIRSIAAAAVTAAEISAISSQTFGEGGDIKGKSHKEGGVNIEAEGGEYVINKRATRKYHGLIDAINKDNPILIAEQIRNRQFHNVWNGNSTDLAASQDPYTKRMYELMKKTPTTYIDSDGCTVKEYPDGRVFIIKKFNRN